MRIPQFPPAGVRAFLELLILMDFSTSASVSGAGALGTMHDWIRMVCTLLVLAPLPLSLSLRTSFANAPLCASLESMEVISKTN